MKRYIDQKLKLRQFRIIAAIATHGSLLKAANSLGLSQPALTKSLREIEDLMEVRLFDRHARGLVANQYGQILAKSAAVVVRELRNLEDALDKIDTDSTGTVAIGALPTAAAGIVPGLYLWMKQSYPDLEMRIIDARADELYSLLDLGEIDLVLGRLYNMDSHSAIVSNGYYSERLALIARAGHPLAGLSAVPSADVERFPIYVPLNSLRIFNETGAFLDAVGITPLPGIDTTSLSLLRDVLSETDMLAAMPMLMLRGDLDRGLLAVIDVAGAKDGPLRPAGIAYRRDRQIKAPMAKFIEGFETYISQDIARRPTFY